MGSNSEGVRVLVVEDDADIVEILALYLSGAGYEVESASDGAAALEALRAREASVILVDLMMPNMNGFDFIKEARLVTTAPIVIVSARDQATDKMLGLDLGADGYIVKPFDPMEVLAYVRAMVRRSEIGRADEVDSRSATVQVGDLELDVDRLAVRKRGTVVPLTASEFKIVSRLMSSPGRVFTKAQLYEVISGEAYGGFESGSDSVMVHVSNIRAKIEDDPSRPEIIETVRGLGYRLGI